MVRTTRRIVGFTLIELLIAVSVSLMVLITAATAFQLYTNLMKRRLSNIEHAFESYQKLDLFMLAVKGITPYMTKRQDKTGFYFLGRDQGFTAVTHNPIFNPGYPAVIRVFREQSAAGKFRLVYEEASIETTLLINADQELPFNHRTIIIDDLATLRFSYFGWENIDAIARMADGEVKRWFENYDGMSALYQPDVIGLRVNETLWQFSLPQRAKAYLGQVDAEI